MREWFELPSKEERRSALGRFGRVELVLQGQVDKTNIFERNCNFCLVEWLFFCNFARFFGIKAKYCYIINKIINQTIFKV